MRYESGVMPRVAAMAKHAARLFSDCSRRKLACKEKPGQEERTRRGGVVVGGAEVASTRVSGASPRGDWDGGHLVGVCENEGHG